MRGIRWRLVLGGGVALGGASVLLGLRPAVLGLEVPALIYALPLAVAAQVVAELAHRGPAAWGTAWAAAGVALPGIWVGFLAGGWPPAAAAGWALLFAGMVATFLSVALVAKPPRRHARAGPASDTGAPGE